MLETLKQFLDKLLVKYGRYKQHSEIHVLPLPSRQKLGQLAYHIEWFPFKNVAFCSPRCLITRTYTHTHTRTQTRTACYKFCY